WTLAGAGVSPASRAASRRTRVCLAATSLRSVRLPPAPYELSGAFRAPGSSCLWTLAGAGGAPASRAASRRTRVCLAATSLRSVRLPPAPYELSGAFRAPGSSCLWTLAGAGVSPASRAASRRTRVCLAATSLRSVRLPPAPYELSGAFRAPGSSCLWTLAGAGASPASCAASRRTRVGLAATSLRSVRLPPAPYELSGAVIAPGGHDWRWWTQAPTPVARRVVVGEGAVAASGRLRLRTRGIRRRGSAALRPPARAIPLCHWWNRGRAAPCSSPGRRCVTRGGNGRHGNGPGPPCVARGRLPSRLDPPCEPARAPPASNRPAGGSGASRLAPSRAIRAASAASLVPAASSPRRRRCTSARRSGDRRWYFTVSI